ncbi:MFS transporter [Rhizobium sp. BR 314]|uniref:MFS transporter n=1 Tax=Rhizobium sp. BR 314 TaxID=3040013 RepID=UPI0039BF8761
MIERKTSISLRVLSLAYFTMGTGTLAIVGTLPEIGSSFSLERGAVAMLVSVLAVTFAISAPGLQMIVGHWPRRTLILAGLALMAAGAFGTAFAPNYPVLFAARVCAGLGAAAIGPVASALGASLVGKERQGHALAVVFSGMTIASVVGVPLSAWGGAVLGWRPTFALIGVATLIVAGLITFFIDSREGGERVRPRDLATIAGRPATAAGIAVMVLEMSGVFVTYTMITLILHDHFGAGPEAVSIALMIFGLAGIGGNYVARWVSQRWSANRAVTVALMALLLVFATLFLGPTSYPAALALLIVWATASDLFMPSQQRRMVELAPAARGLVLALNSSAIYVGMAAGSLTAGTLYPLFGLSSLPLASIAFLALAFAALALSSRAAAKPDHVAATTSAVGRV